MVNVKPLIGRILIAAIFLMSGAGKVFAWSDNLAFAEPSLGSFAAIGLIIAIIFELGGGLSLLFGYKTKVGAISLIIFTAATALAFHANFADPNQMVHFMKNVAIIGGLLIVYNFGAGPISLDNKRKRR